VGYLAEHELAYIGETSLAGSVVASAFAFWRRSWQPATRVELWALFGGVVGAYLGAWIVLATVLT
jgi:hypothetical protein